MCRSRAPNRTLIYGFGLGGALIKDKSSFNLNVFGINVVRHAQPQRRPADRHAIAARSALKTPRDNLFVNGQVDYALTLDQTLRFGYNVTRFTNDNLGVGGYDEPERALLDGQPRRKPRASSTSVRSAAARSRARGSSSSGPTRARHRRPRRRRFACSTPSPAAARSAPAAIISHAFDVGSDLDYVLGQTFPPHRRVCSMAAGIARTRPRTISGTYTFDNLQAFLANQPSNYTRRLGDPNIAYRNPAGRRSTSRTTFACGRT